MALGAKAIDVVRLIGGEVLLVTTLGLGFGIAGAWAATRFLGGLLFEVKPGDSVTYIAVSAVLIIAVLGSYAPARRAMRVDPMTAVRSL